MPESKKLVIVDGIELAEVFQFPRIFGAITSSLQLSRLAIALLMVAALMAFGNLWDRLTMPTVHPSGLGVLEGSIFETRALQQALHSAMNTYAADKFPEGTPELDPRWVLKTIPAGYLTKRDAATTPEERERIERSYDSTVKMIEATRPKGAFEATVTHVQSRFIRSHQAIINGRFMEAFDYTMELARTPGTLWKSQPWFTIIYGLFFMLVFAVGGGAISRIAAVQFAGEGERLSLRGAVDFALNRWLTLVWAQALPLIIVAIVCLKLAIIGLLMAVPVLDIIGGLLYGLMLLFGLLVTFLVLGYALGFPLIVPSVACENSDGADAVQRSYSYVVGKPLHLIGYWIVAKIGYVIGFVLVAVFAALTLNLTAAAFGAWTNNPAMSVARVYSLFDLTHQTTAAIPTWHSSWAATLISFWQGLLVSLVVAYAFAYHFSASTIVYLLIRRACDGQTLDDIWREEAAGALPAVVVATETTVVVGE